MATLPSTETSRRIVTLDIVRGLAVMGILAMNIVAFAMPPQAYINPLAYGTETAADFAVWAFNFVFVDGKMRGLFSFLFGASMLLVAELAASKGESAKSVIFRRQLWLAVFGLIHFYFIWFGDILFHYALIGMIAFAFRRKAPKALVRWGIAFLILQLVLMAASSGYAHMLADKIAAGTASPDELEAWKSMSRDVAVPSAEKMREIMALYLGPWTGIVRYQLTEQATMPLFFTILFGAETLAYMLFGMAGLKSGFLTGEWDNRRYLRWAAVGLAIAIPAYIFIACRVLVDGFTVPGIFTWIMTATVPFRPLMIVAYAGLIIVATRRGGWLVDRIASAGRAAFSNYLGTSLLMTFIFYGWGLGFFGQLSRAQLWLVVIGAGVLMLAWSKPWLDRFNYGPFEWLWRSLSRWKLQPMRKRLPQGAAAAEA